MIRVDESDPVGELEPSFPYRDVTIRRGVQFKDQYDIQSEIGRGKFGTVYRCKEKSNGLTLAAKVVNTGRKEDRRAVEREVEIMRRLQHPRLIQLYDAIDTGTSVYVILELIEGGELFERVIGDDFVLTERSCAVFMRQICEGIEFVHGQNILHLDMKPENILCLTKEGNRIKIIDFGLARKYDPEKKLQVLFGTPEFVAPEVVNFDQIGFGTDMWSIGVICYVLLSGLSPFMGDTDIETMANVTIAKYDFDDEAFAEISSEAKDFIRSLLVKDKGGRATAAQCREHAWLKRKNPPAPRTKIGAKSEVENSSMHKANMHNGTKEELEVSKDNLRLFVERWREHPDSPYGVTNFIPGCEPVRETGVLESGEGFLESISTRGQSPSPCGSLTSSVDSVNIAVANDNYSLTIPGGRGPFERRASEGTAAGHEKHRDPAVQIVLAEEIIKLSEHLRAIAAAPRIVSEETTTPSKTARSMAEPQQSSGQSSRSETMQQPKSSPPKNPQPTSTINKKSNMIIRDTASFGKSIGLRLEKQPSIGRAPEAEAVQVNEISDKLSRITNQRKTNGTAFGGVSRFTSTNSEFSTTTSFGPRKTRRLVDVNTSSTSSNDSVHQRSGSLFSRSMSSSTSEYKTSNSRLSSRMESKQNEGSRREESLQQESTSGHPRVSDPIAINSQDSTRKHIDLTPPWRRTKLHRFTETCRDVPRISNLQDIHRGLNFDEPTSTKNLLLQLLEEWDDVHTGTRPNGIGRKSVSLDWCGEESVARRSMSSLAEYFQSEQQKPPPGEPTPSGTADSGSTVGTHMAQSDSRKSYPQDSSEALRHQKAMDQGCQHDDGAETYGCSHRPGTRLVPKRFPRK